MKRFGYLLLAGSLLASLAACSSDDAGSAEQTNSDPAAFETSFVGEIAGTDAFVAVAVRDDKVWAYFCDGQGTGDSNVANYLTGALSDTHVTAVDEEGAALDATLDGDVVSGSVTLPDGSDAAFTATRATGDAGWFSAQVGDATHSEAGSWIRLADGRVRGTVVAVTEGAGGAGTPAEPDQLGGSGGVLPPAAVPTGGLNCFLKTRKYFKLLTASVDDLTITDTMLGTANQNRRTACGST